MSREVWKFEVPAGRDRGVVTMPLAAQIVDVGVQERKVYVWAAVDPNAPTSYRALGYFATGEPVPDGWDYVGTAHVHDGPLLGSVGVFHVFEDVPF